MLHVFLLPLVVQTATLSVTAPDGYRDASQDMAKGAGLDAKAMVALVAGTPGKADASSITFLPSEHLPEAKLDDAKECAAFAENMRARQDGSTGSSSIVAGPRGKTCQIAVTFKSQDAVVVSTIVRGPKDTYVMTCTMRTKNTAAMKQCQRALGTVKFK